ncbi:MAG: CoA transferase [Proteobacteria bacterium]|nr:CoA transferase [Pseudomonadota bacterium]
MNALNDIRILDLTSGPAGGIATMILADFGAQVLTIERPDDALAHLPAARMWRRGKRLLQLDLASAEGLSDLHQLCAGADVLICNWRTSALVRKGLDYASISVRHPHLVFCHISGFGSHGPRADYPAYEHLVAACTGRMRLFAGLCDREGPVFSALQVGVHATSQSAASGVLAALFARRKDGRGRLVETSLLQGLLPYEQGAMLAQQFHDLHPDLYPAMQSATPLPPMPSLYYHPAQAGDGRWMQFGNLMPHLFDHFLMATDLIDIVADPDWNATQMLLPPAKHEAFRERMLKRIQERPADDWMSDFIADGGIVATAHQTTQQALNDPDIVANGHVIKRDDGGVQLGPLCRLTRTPAVPGSDAIADDGFAQAWRSDPRPDPAASGERGLPLAGVRVVELATIIAAPLGASFLADMGADVIKVEQIGGDPYRGLGLGMGSARVNAGKRSVSVDLKSAAGKEIVLGLIKQADVLIHNFRPGVPERLGIGYAQVCAVNPSIVYLQSNGYGPDGPGALRPSTHPVPGAAMGGVMYQMREALPEAVQDMEDLRLWTSRLMRANEVNPDPNTAMVVCTSVLLGLLARSSTGEGQQILIDMFGANAYANHDDFLAYPGKKSRAMADELMHGLAPGYRLYPAAGGQWIFLAVVSRREQRRFVDAVKQAGFEAPPDDAFNGGGDELVAQLTALFAQREGQYWEDLLTVSGVGCVRADACLPSEFWLKDPQSQALGLTQSVSHPQLGEYRRHGTNVVFDGEVANLKPPPSAGQHNSELLSQLGYSAAEIAAFEADGTIWRETS